MSDWVFDSLICFLHSPSWHAAIQNFIEERSIAFDPNIEIDISDPQYIQIHNEYKNLVDFMLGSFMEELSITPEEFEIACMEGKNLSLLTKDESDGHSFSFHKGLFQQIWAANDIRTFVRLMKQRNLEIQIQALDLIERRQASLQESTTENEPKSEENENRVGGGGAGGMSERQKTAEDIIEEEIEKSVEAESQIISEASEVQQDDDINDKFKRLNLFFEQEKAKTNADVESRQEYLRQQRDKILHIKKQARARQLYETSKDRPKSAVAAQKIIDGEIEIIQPDEASVQVRKMLAKKLRDEVVNNNTTAAAGLASEES